MKVSIVMGSKSDLDLAKAAGEILDTLDVPYTINILSAHRTPELLHTHIDEAIADGVRVFIGIAGLAAHLAGNVASKTTRPVIGVPGVGGPLNGFDALLSTVQMPKGVPVATVATGTPFGICTVDKRASNPFKGPPSPGTPMTGSVVLEATFPAK